MEGLTFPIPPLQNAIFCLTNLQLAEILEFLRTFGVEPSENQPRDKSEEEGDDKKIDWWHKEVNEDGEVEKSKGDWSEDSNEHAEENWHALL